VAQPLAKRATYRFDPETGQQTYTVEAGGKVSHGRNHFERFRHMVGAQYARRGRARDRKPSTGRPRGADSPRARRVSRSSMRAADSGDDGPEPEPPRRRRVNGRDEIERWLAERRRALDALQTERQLELEERVA
jgi:hypothetical protein